MYHFEKLDTPQKVFDYVVKKVYEQGCKSGTAGLCQYKDSQGNKCALGHLIPSNLYRKELENMILGKKFLSKIKSERFKGFIVANYELLLRLQAAHDGAWSIEFRSSFLQRANSVAYDFILQPYKPTKFYKDILND